MRSRTAALLLALFLAASARPAHAYTYGDTLTTIWRPLPNLPALVRPGDTFTVWANAPSTASGWAASLGYGALNVPLIPAGGGWQPTKNRWELQYTVPPNTPEEVYALFLTSDSTLPDVAAHAVKVYPAFPSDYYFAQISDTHLPTHTLSSGGSINTADTTGMADFDAVIEDLNGIHPQFIIHTGDLVNEGELEEYLGMYEMGRAQGMLSRLRDPVFVSSGNHDIGGWGATAPPDGTSRKDWWRYFGWPYLENPPAGDPYHSQDFTFDFGPLHVIGLEAYINNGSYDHYRQDLWGAQSFTPEQMTWLANDIAAQPPGTHKLLFYHYDFGGTLANGSPGANFTQINPATLGIDGAIWGHNHGVGEGNRVAQPFNLGLQSVIDRRAFRIFRVHNGVMTPAPMHHSGAISGALDSLAFAWSGPNDGSRSALSVTVTNRFLEAFEHARLTFYVADHESSFTATGGTVAQILRQSGYAEVSVDCVFPATGTANVSVQPDAPIAGVPEPVSRTSGLQAVGPNPFRAGGSTALAIRFALDQPQHVALDVFDLSGRRVARLEHGAFAAGVHTVTWNGSLADGTLAPAGVYVVRLQAGARVETRRIAVVR
jgi:Calcineurin-like phosphoesterase/FlgD Ig-like domain